MQSESCFDYLTLFNASKFINEGCIALMLSKLLSYIIIAGSLMFKVPQIIKIISAKSTKGISALALIIETLSLLITTSYSYRSEFPLSTYAEMPIVFIQNLILLSLISYYQMKQLEFNKIGITVWFFIIFEIISLNNNIIPFIIIEIMYSLQIITTIGSVLPQIYKIYIQKYTGQLSFSTVTFAFIGCIVRLFTTIKEINDIIAILLISISTIMRGILFFQFFIYCQ